MRANRTIRTSGKRDGSSVSLSNLSIIKDCMLFDECSGKFHRISESAAFVVRALQAKAAMPNIIVAYSQEYELPLTVAARDIELFMNDIATKEKE